jgi:hypothetical protein
MATAKKTYITYRFVYSNSKTWVDYPDGHPGTETHPPFCAAIKQIMRGDKVISEDMFVRPEHWVSTDQPDYMDAALEARKKTN